MATTSTKEPFYLSLRFWVFVVYALLVGVLGVLGKIGGEPGQVPLELVATVGGIVAAWIVGRSIRPGDPPLAPLGLILAIFLGLGGAGCGATMTDVLPRLVSHAGCAVNCIACISSIHGGGGEGFRAPTATQARCAADCARCGFGMAEDLSALARSAPAEGPVEPAPLPEAERDEALIRALPAAVLRCPAPPVPEPEPEEQPPEPEDADPFDGSTPGDPGESSPVESTTEEG